MPGMTLGSAPWVRHAQRRHRGLPRASFSGQYVGKCGTATDSGRPHSPFAAHLGRSAAGRPNLSIGFLNRVRKFDSCRGHYRFEAAGRPERPSSADRRVLAAHRRTRSQSAAGMVDRAFWGLGGDRLNPWLPRRPTGRGLAAAAGDFRRCPSGWACRPAGRTILIRSRPETRIWRSLPHDPAPTNRSGDRTVPDCDADRVRH
jgi:hypothetical protein